MVKHYCYSCGEDCISACSERITGSPTINGVIINFEILFSVGSGFDSDVGSV